MQRIVKYLTNNCDAWTCLRCSYLVSAHSWRILFTQAFKGHVIDALLIGPLRDLPVERIVGLELEVQEPFRARRPGGTGARRRRGRTGYLARGHRGQIPAGQEARSARLVLPVLAGLARQGGRGTRRAHDIPAPALG
jgi:hypothetical protein